MTVSVSTGFGWVLATGPDGFVGNVGQLLPDGVDDVGEWVKKTLEAEGITSVVVDYFAFALDGIVLVAKDSVNETDGWSAPLEWPDHTPEDQWARELQQALDSLGLEDANLGQPGWFAYAAYG